MINWAIEIVSKIEWESFFSILRNLIIQPEALNFFFREKMCISSAAMPNFQKILGFNATRVAHLLLLGWNIFCDFYFTHKRNDTTHYIVVHWTKPSLKLSVYNVALYSSLHRSTLLESIDFWTRKLAYSFDLTRQSEYQMKTLV